MSTKFHMRVGILTDMRHRGGRRAAKQAKAEADDVESTFRRMMGFTDEVIEKQRLWQFEALTYLSTMQLIRFSIKDVIDISEGKGGLAGVLGNMLSLTTSLVLLSYQYQRITQMNIGLTATLSAMSAGLGPAGWAIAGLAAGAALGGGLAFAQQQRMAPILAAREMRRSAAEAIGLQVERQTEIRRELQKLRSMGVE